jgi:hypothetical protein
MPDILDVSESGCLSFIRSNLGERIVLAPFPHACFDSDFAVGTVTGEGAVSCFPSIMGRSNWRKRNAANY